MSGIAVLVQWESLPGKRLSSVDVAGIFNPWLEIIAADLQEVEAMQCL